MYCRNVVRVDICIFISDQFIIYIYCDKVVVLEAFEVVCIFSFKLQCFFKRFSIIKLIMKYLILLHLFQKHVMPYVDHVRLIYSQIFDSSSSCHQTFRFHWAVHWYPTISLNFRSFNVHGYVKREHRNICTVFSSSSPHAHIVSPLK